MGVAGAWAFLQYKNINVSKCKDIKHLSALYRDKIIHVDMVGAFYDSIRQCFLSCLEHEHEKKLNAAKKLLTEISKVINKSNSILYLNGKPTLERDYTYCQRIEKRLMIQETLEKELSNYMNHSTDSLYQNIVYLSQGLFQVEPDIKALIYKTAIENGWNAVMATGEAEVEIGRAGGIVLTRDSDLLFHPKIDTVICPFNGTYHFYDKTLILTQLGLTKEMFSLLGIIAKNDYDVDFYADKEPEMDERERMTSIYDQVFDIQQKDDGSSEDDVIKAALKTYISLMNAKTGRSITFDDYENSYSIFALQEEQLLPEGYDPKLYEINRSALYLSKAHGHLHRYSRQT